MSYLVHNPITGERFNFTDETSANIKVEELKSIVSSSEEYRFTIAKETKNGDDTTWTTVDLDNDPEDCTYHVFNTCTGQHEKYHSLSSAKFRKDEMKNEFINSLTFFLNMEDIPLDDN